MFEYWVVDKYYYSFVVLKNKVLQTIIAMFADGKVTEFNSVKINFRIRF